MNIGKLLRNAASALMLIALLVAAGLPADAFAQANTTYFVNNQTGSDANAGTDSNNPKQTLFGVNGALAAATDGATISVANTGVAYTANNDTDFDQSITLTSTGGTPNLNPGGAGTGTFTFDNAGETTTFTGAFTLTGNVTLNNATQAIAGADNLTLAVTTFTVTAGSITGSPSGTIATLLYNGAADRATGVEFSGPAVANLSVNTTGGRTITASASKTITGVLDVDAGETLALVTTTLTLSRTSTGTNTHDVDGEVSATTGGISLISSAANAHHTFASGSVTGELPSVTVNLTGTGSTAQIGDALNSSNGPDVINGSITVTAGNANVYAPTGNTTSTGITGSLINNGSGAVVVDASGDGADTTLRIGGNLVNAGTGTIAMGTAGEADIFNIIGDIRNEGTMTQTSTAASIAGQGLITFVGAAASPVVTVSGSVTNNPTFTGTTDNASGGVGDLDGSGIITFGDAALTVTGALTNSPNATGMTPGADGSFGTNGRIAWTAHTAARAISVGSISNAGTGFGAGDGGNAAIAAVGAQASTTTLTGTGGIANSCVTTNNANGICNIDLSVWTGANNAGAGGVSIAAGSTQADILFGTGGLTTTGSVANNSTSGNSNITGAGAAATSVGGFSAAGGNVNFNSTAAFTSTGTGTVTGGKVTISSTATSAVNGTLTISGGELEIANGTGTTFAAVNITGGTFDLDGAGATATFNGNFVQSGGAVETAGDTWDMNLDMSLTGGTRTFGAATALTFTGGVAQTLTSSAGVVWGTGTTSNMTVTNTATTAPGLTLAGANFGINGTLTFSTPGVGQPSPRVAAGAFRFIVNGNAFTNNGGYSTSGDTGGVQLANTAGATTIDGTADFSNLEIATTGQTATMTEGNNGATRQYTMTGLLSLTSGTLETSNAANNATSDELRFNGTPTVKIGAGVFGGNMTNGDANDEFVFTSAVDVIYAGTGNVNTTATANFLTGAGATGIDDVTIAIGGVTPTLTLGQALTYNGSLTVPNATTLALGNNNLNVEGTSFVNNGTMTAGTGVIDLSDAVGTAVSGTGDLVSVTVTSGTNTIANSTINGTLTSNGGSVTLNQAAPGAGEENIEGDLTTAAGTVTLGADISVGQDLHHGGGLLAFGANSLTVGVDVAAGTHTLGTTAGATFSGTGSLIIVNSAAGNPSLAANAGGSTISVPLQLNLSAATDDLDVTTGPLTLSNTVTLTRGDLDGGTAVTFTGSSVTLTDNGDLDASANMTFAPASGTQTLTVTNANPALKGTADFIQNGDLSIVTGAAGISFPVNFTQTMGALSIGGNMTVNDDYTLTAGSVTQGANNITVVDNFTRVAGTFSQSTGALILQNGVTPGTGLSIPNLTLNSAGVEAFGAGTTTVTGTLVLNNTGGNAYDITTPGTTVALSVASGANVTYRNGSFDVAPNYQGPIGVLASTNTADRAIPATVWPTTATVNLFRVNGGFDAGLPGSRTVQNEVHVSGTGSVLDLDGDVVGTANSDLTVANSTLRMTGAALVEGGAGGANTGGDLLFTNAPDVIYELDGATPTTGEELDNAGTIASLTVTRSTNVANSGGAGLTWSRTTTVNGDVNIRNTFTLTGTLTVLGNITASSESGTFALATAPTVAGAGTVVLGGTTAQTLTAGTYGNITVNNAAGVSTTGAVTVTNLTGTNGQLTVGGALTVAGTMTVNASDVVANSNITFTGGANTDLVLNGTGVVRTNGNAVVILTHATTANQGFTRNATGLGGCIYGSVRKTLVAALPNRYEYPVCDTNGNFREAAVTFRAGAAITATNTMTVRHVDSAVPLPTAPATVNGIPFSDTDNTNASFNVARFSPFYWLVTMGFDEVPAVGYDVELRAAGYSAFSGEDIERLRAVRQINGAATNFWSGVAAGAANNDNFAASTTEPVSISRGAVGLLGDEGTLFAYGLESNMTVTNPAAVTLNGGTSTTIALSGVFGGGTPAFTYAVTSSDASVTASEAGGTLTINGVSAGTANVQVVATDAVGDTRTATVAVTVNAAFSAGTGAITAVTLNPTQTGTADLSALFTGGATPYTYAVSSSDNAVATGAEAAGTLTTTGVAQGTATITVIGTDALGSTATATQAVTVNAAMAAAAIADVTVTQGASDTSTDIAATFTGGSGAYTYTVTPTADPVATASLTGTVITVGGVAAYNIVGTTVSDSAPVTITVQATDGLGSMVSQTFSVNVMPVQGDVDGDGDADIFDAVAVLDFAVGIGTPTAGTKQFGAADWNSNGTIQAFDAFSIFNASSPKADLIANAVADLGWGEVTRAERTAELPIAVMGDRSKAVASQLWTTIDPEVAKVTGVTFHVEEAVASAYNVSEEGELSLAVIGGIIPSDGVIATISLEFVETGSDFTLAARGAVNDNAAADIAELEVVELPDEFALLGNYPNPFNPSTTIQFDLPEASEVSVEIYDMLGRRVMLLPKQALQAGAKRSLQLNASALASGSYFYRVIAKTESAVHIDSGRMLLIK